MDKGGAAGQQAPAMIADTAPKIPLIDPTLNVKEKIGSTEDTAAGYRAADTRYFEMITRKDREYSNAMREAETRRWNDLSKQKAEFDSSQADLLRLQVSNNAKLVSDQLDRITTVMSDRIARLEQFRYESSGKGTGQSAVMAAIVTVVSLAVAVGSIAITLFRH